MNPNGIEVVDVSDLDVDAEVEERRKRVMAAAAAGDLAPADANFIGDMMRDHRTAKAAVEAGVDRKTIVAVAMDDGDVMAWLLATIPGYAKEKDGVRGSSPLSRRSLASRACVCASPSLSRRACAIHATRVFCVCVAVCSLGGCRSTGPLRTTGQRR